MNSRKGKLLYSVWLTEEEAAYLEADTIRRTVGKIIKDAQERGDFERR